MQNADIMTAFFFRASSVADGVNRSSMYAGSCVLAIFPGCPGRSMFCGFLLDSRAPGVYQRTLSILLDWTPLLGSLLAQL